MPLGPLYNKTPSIGIKNKDLLGLKRALASRPQEDFSHTHKEAVAIFFSLHQPTSQDLEQGTIIGPIAYWLSIEPNCI